MFYDPIWEYGQYQLVRRPDTPNYYITWFRPGSGRLRRKTTGTADLDEARQRLIDFSNVRDRAKQNEPHHVKILDVLTEYVDRRETGRKRATQTSAALRYMTEFFTGWDVVYIDDLNQRLIDRYVQWRRRRLLADGYQASNGTLNRDLSILRAALNEAVRMGDLSRAPVFRMLSQPPSRQRVLSVDECHRLLAACEAEHLRMFVLIALHTLQRPGAIFDLHRDRIDFPNNRIDFHKPGAARTNKRRPVVPISKTLRPSLIEAVLRSHSGYLIERNGNPVTNVRRGFRTACDRAGLGPDVITYTLRHTGATLLAGEGVPLRQIAGMLGHSQLITTELYAKHQPEYLSDASAALDRALAST